MHFQIHEHRVTTIALLYFCTGKLNMLFQLFSFKSIIDQIWPCHKVGQGRPRVIIYINFYKESPRCYIPSFKAIRQVALEKNFFFCFYHIHVWAWPPSWSCDLGQKYKLPFPLCLEAACEIQNGQGVTEKSSENVDDGQWMDWRQILPSCKLSQSPWLRGATKKRLVWII